MNLLASVIVSCDAHLVTVDVVCMYSSIDNRAVIAVCGEPAVRVGYNGKLMFDILLFIMVNVFCQADGQYHHQVLHAERLELEAQIGLYYRSRQILYTWCIATHALLVCCDDSPGCYYCFGCCFVVLLLFKASTH